MKELFWAARHGRVAEIGEALAAGADIDWRHPVDGRTPLGAAAAFDQLEALEALLAGGAALEARESETGLTPLGVAVLEGSARCLGALLRAGADVDATDADGWTPLMHAAARNQLFEAQSLKAAGASLGANVDGVGARELAASEGHDAVLALLSQVVKPSLLPLSPPPLLPLPTPSPPPSLLLPAPSRMAAPLAFRRRPSPPSLCHHGPTSRRLSPQPSSLSLTASLLLLLPRRSRHPPPSSSPAGPPRRPRRRSSPTAARL